jgi:hypothetical protein
LVDCNCNDWSCELCLGMFECLDDI